MFIQRLCALLVLSALVVSAETDYRFAFPQSEFLLGMDLKWLMKSPLGVKLRNEAKSSLTELKPLEAILDQVDSVHLSVISKTTKSSDLLMLVDGRFNLDQLAELGVKNGFRVEQWGKVRILMPKPETAKPPVRGRKVEFRPAQFGIDVAKTKPAIALMDVRHILIGEEAPLRVALERLETGLVPQGNPLFERARDLEAANDIWMVGNTAPLNLAAATDGKTQDPMSQMAREVRNFSFGVAVRRNLAMDLQLQTTSPKVATQMLDMMKGVTAMAKMAPKEYEQMPVDLDRVLQFSATGNIVRASVTLEQDDMDKLMASALMPMGLRTKPGAAPAPAAPAAPVVAAAPVAPAAPVVAPKPAEPVRKTVMIYGLPGGPKEVPVQ